MTVKKEDAFFFTEDGDIISGISNVNEKVREILSVDYEQFKQLSMLAQGEFLDLLTTKSNQRADVFRSIFIHRFIRRCRFWLVKRQGN